MKLLVVSDGTCYPPNSGGTQAVFNSIYLLQKHVELHVVIVDNLKNSDLDIFRQECSNTKISLYNNKFKDKYELISAFALKFRSLLIKLFKLKIDENYRNKILDINLSKNWRLYSFLNNYIYKNKIDIIQFEFERPLTWAKGITSNVKKVFVQHEIQYIVCLQKLQQQKQISYEDEMFYNISKNIEIHNLNFYDAIITLSENDKQQLVKDGVYKPIFNSFAKVRLNATNKALHTNITKITFIGPEAHVPNKNGILWFLKDVWPLVLEAKPFLKFHIIGNWTYKTKKMILKNYKNVEFTGYISNLEDEISGSVSIIPILQASGIRMKILEAVNTRVPFVSTNEGAVGLGFKNGENCYITNEPEEFAKSIINLIDNPELVDKLTTNAIEYLNEVFSDKAFINSRMLCYNNFSS